MIESDFGGYKYIIYKTINIVNGHIYIGAHKTKNESDSYLGSGEAIRKAIRKYGKENFKKEILYVFDNEKDMFAKEHEIVTEEFCKKPGVYNEHIGGKGGFSHINDSEVLTEKRLKALRRKAQEHQEGKTPQFCLLCGVKIIDYRKRKFCSCSCSAKYNNSQREYSEETGEKISKALRKNPLKYCKCGKKIMYRNKMCRNCKKKETLLRHKEEFLKIQNLRKNNMSFDKIGKVLGYSGYAALSIYKEFTN